MTIESVKEVNDMNLPGFTAEASLFTKSALYRLSGVTGGGKPNTIEPALCGKALRKCVIGITNHDPTASIWCTMFDVFCGIVY
jgi:hypothetical protein